MAGSRDDGPPSPSSENHHQPTMMSQLATGRVKDNFQGQRSWQRQKLSVREDTLTRSRLSRQQDRKIRDRS
jgi:hypothetical protein